MRKRNEKLYKAFEIIAGKWVDDASGDTSESPENPSLDDEFLQQILAKYHQYEMSAKRNLRSYIYKIAIICALLLASSITVYALYSAGLLYKILPFNTDIGSTNEVRLETIETIYLPKATAIVGYSQIDETKPPDNASVAITEYEANDGGFMMIIQQLATTYNIDNENTVDQKLKLHGDLDAFYSVKNNQSTIIWTQYDYFFELTIYPAVGTERMTAIAESFVAEPKSRQYQALCFMIAITLSLLMLSLKLWFRIKKKK